jgi:hypothetical protein
MLDYNAVTISMTGATQKTQEESETYRLEVT